MNKIKKLLFFAIFSTATNACYATPSACTTSSPEDLHAPLSIDNNIAIRFRMATTPIDPHGEIFPITIVSQECNSGEITKIADLPYLGDPGKIDSALLADSDFDGIAELFVVPEDGGNRPVIEDRQFAFTDRNSRGDLRLQLPRRADDGGDVRVGIGIVVGRS